MAIPSWPATVPYASEVDQWSIKPFRDPIETEMESGDVRTRRRPGDNLAVMTWGLALEPEELAAFKSFVEADLFRGVSRFRMMASLDGTTFVERTVQMQVKTLQYEALGRGLVRPKFTAYVFPASVVS